MSASALTGPPRWSTAGVTRTVVGRRTVLSVSGEIDLDSVLFLADAVDDAVAGGAVDLWLDFSSTEFMDSSGVHLLSQTQVRLDSLSRRLAVVCPSGPVRRLLDLSGVAERLAIYNDLDAAHRAS